MQASQSAMSHGATNVQTQSVLATTAAAAATVAATAETAQSLHTMLALLFQPVWRAEHLKFLKVKGKTEISASTMIGKFQLPRDGNNDFEDLVTEISQATDTDILDLPLMRDDLHHNTFWNFFSSLYEITGFDTRALSQNTYVRAAKTAMRGLIEPLMPYADDQGSLRLDCNSVPFHLQRLGVKGILACDACIIKTDVRGRMSPLPVVALSVVRPKDDEDVEAQEASQLVLQAALAHEQNSTFDAYKAFAIRVNKTKLQVVSANIPRVYLERLYQGKPCYDGFEVLHSKEFNMFEIEGRKEMLRIVLGLLKTLCRRPVQR